LHVLGKERTVGRLMRAITFIEAQRP